MSSVSTDIREHLNVSRETYDRLQTYVDLLKKWNPTINLVSRSSLKSVWTRHILDSVQVYRSVNPIGRWVDLGSGGGFPGVVCAILSKGESTGLQHICVESDQRKCAFLRNVIRQCEIDCSVKNARIEALPPMKASILSARALTDLTSLLRYTEIHLADDGVALFPKGENWKKEVADAQKEWKFSYEAITSLTEVQAVLLKVKGVSRV